MISSPSLSDFGTHDESRYPELWEGCVGAWAPCLGPTGTRLHDFSRGSNWGTLTNMDAATDWVMSGGRYALDFDGVNDFVDVGNLSRFSFGPNSAFTLSVWANLNSLPGSSIFGLMGKGSYGSNLEYNFYIGEVSSQVRFTVADGTTNTAFIGRLTPSVTSTAWAHYLARYDGSGTSAGCSIWINGIRADNANYQLGTYSAMANLGSIVSFGALNAGANFRMSGRMDDARIYNRAISPSEIRLLATCRGIAYERRKRRSVFFDAAFFNPAWARNSNYIISPVGAA